MFEPPGWFSLWLLCIISIRRRIYPRLSLYLLILRKRKRQRRTGKSIRLSPRISSHILYAFCTLFSSLQFLWMFHQFIANYISYWNLWFGFSRVSTSIRAIHLPLYFLFIRNCCLMHTAKCAQDGNFCKYRRGSLVPGFPITRSLIDLPKES